MKLIFSIFAVLAIPLMLLGQIDTSSHKANWSFGGDSALDNIESQWGPHKFNTKEIQTKLKTKPPKGTVPIYPIRHVLPGVKLKLQEATTLSRLPIAGRFYFEKNAYDRTPSNATVEWWVFYDKAQDLGKFDTVKTLQPFFIKQYEVTNGEYRTFLNSNHPNHSYQELTPNETCWSTDFPKGNNLPYINTMETSYFSQVEYRDYPVVGVSYYQAKAYCDWYEDKLNKETKVDGYVWEVDLPNQYEWGFANGDYYTPSYVEAEKGLNYVNRFYDDYRTDLRLKSYADDAGFLDYMLTPAYSNPFVVHFMQDQYFYTAPYTERKKVKSEIHKDVANKVLYLNSNVSEWCAETYHGHWKKMYEARQKTLASDTSNAVRLVAEIEKIYNTRNDTINGQLVRGSNWYCEKHLFQQGRNVGGQSPKIFIDPNSQHATLGFRYVLRLVPVLELTGN